METNNDKLDTMNNKLYNRNIPSNLLQPNFDPRPISTKYAIMPILDPTKEIMQPKDNYLIYNNNETFFPGTSKPHFNGYRSKIIDENMLRNQYFALQKADQAKYIPSSKSDLYEYNVNNVSNSNLEKGIMFREMQFNNFNPNPHITIGNNIFNNSTRVQLKNL
tara:strand:- start:558 stop:1046 length:489 start_codon:yes stop_codon:yes gene_type:complete